MEYEKSCGAVVYTKKDNVVKYVLIHSIKGDWGFPKGHMENGESEEQTALREIYEEVDLKVNILSGFRRVVEYPLPDKENVMKQVVYFCAEYSDQDIKALESELTTAVLVPYEEAMKLLSHENAKKILQEANDFLEKEVLWKK